MGARDLWKSIPVHNSHMLVKLYAEETGKIGVYLSPATNDGQRMNMGAPDGAIVFRPGFYTDSSEGRHRRQSAYGNKIFSRYAHGYDMAKAMEAAREWAVEKYKVGPEFVPIVGFGRDRFPQEIADWAKQKLAEIRKQQKAGA